MRVNDWIQRFVEEALKNNDQQRLQLIFLAQQGDSLRASDPQIAYKVYEVGRALAEELTESCWVLYFAQRMANVCIYELEDLDRAMNLVTRDYVLSSKDSYLHCPINSAIRINLVETYLYYDPVGYADTIHEVIHYLREIEPDDEYTTLKLDDFMAQLYLKLNQLDKALDFALRALDEGYSYLTLTRIYWERGDYRKALEISELRIAENRYSPFMLADSRAWTAAMLMQTSGDEIRAKSLYQQAIFHINKINFVPNSTLYDALAGYHEASNHLNDALKVRDDQLMKQQSVAGPEEAVIVRLRRARLLGRLNQLDTMRDQVVDIQRHLNKFKRPDHYRQLLSLIENGNYSDVIWQSL